MLSQYDKFTSQLDLFDEVWLVDHLFYYRNVCFDFTTYSWAHINNIIRLGKERESGGIKKGLYKITHYFPGNKTLYRVKSLSTNIIYDISLHNRSYRTNTLSIFNFIHANKINLV
jgi:hypothetical protein